MLRETLHDLGTHRGHAVLIEGQPGIGKSALVRAVMSEAQAAGHRVVWAACDELSRAFPLLPLREAIASHTPGGVRESLGAPWWAQVPAHAGTDLVSALTDRLIAEVYDLSTEPLLLVVDDLHWADAATVTAVGRLTRMCRHRPVMLVGTMRPVPRRPDLAAVRRSIGSAATLRLGALSGSDVRELVIGVLNAAPGPDLVTLAAKASGNPLYLTELLATLRQSDRLTNRHGQVDVQGLQVPGSLGAVISDRLTFLSQETRALLSTAALLGPDFHLPQLAAVTGRPAGALVPLVEEAIANDVLLDEGGVLAFRHPLIRDALYEQMSPAVRAVSHREVAQVLAKAGAAPEQVARQLLPTVEGTGLGADEWMEQWLVTDGQPVVDHAPAVAVPLLTRVIERLTAASGPRDLLTSRLAEALFRIGESKRAAEVARTALLAATDPDAIVSFYYTLAQALAMEGRTEEFFEELEPAMTSPMLDARHRARLLTLSARSHRSSGQLTCAVRAAEKALHDARVADDVWAEGWALGVLAFTRGMEGDASSALPLIDQALRVTHRHPALADLRLILQINQSVTLGELGRHDEAIEVGRRACELTNQTGSGIRRAQAHAVLAELLFDLGRWDEAVPEARAAIGLSEEPVVQVCVGGIAAVIGFHRDEAEAGELLTTAERYLALIPGRLIGPFYLARSLHQERFGSMAKALMILVPTVLEGQEPEEIAELLPDAVRLAKLQNERSTASAFCSRADGLAAGSNSAHRRAIAAHCRGMFEDDPARLQEAVEGYVESRRPLSQARAMEALGTPERGAGKAR